MSCQEEVPKKKARPLRRPAAPGSLRCSFATGGCGTRGFAPQTVLALFPLRPALLDDAKGRLKTSRASTASGIDSAWCAFPSPSCSAEQRNGAGGSRRGLSEGLSPEFRSRPAVRVAQGSRQRRPRNVVVAFSLAFFLQGDPKERMPARQARNTAVRNPADDRPPQHPVLSGFDCRHRARNPYVRPVMPDACVGGKKVAIERDFYLTPINRKYIVVARLSKQ